MRHAAEYRVVYAYTDIDDEQIEFRTAVIAKWTELFADQNVMTVLVFRQNDNGGEDEILRFNRGSLS